MRQANGLEAGWGFPTGSWVAKGSGWRVCCFCQERKRHQFVWTEGKCQACHVRSCCLFFLVMLLYNLYMIVFIYIIYLYIYIYIFFFFYPLLIVKMLSTFWISGVSHWDFFPTKNPPRLLTELGFGPREFPEMFCPFCDTNQKNPPEVAAHYTPNYGDETVTCLV